MFINFTFSFVTKFHFHEYMNQNVLQLLKFDKIIKQSMLIKFQGYFMNEKKGSMKILNLDLIFFSFSR